MGTDKSIDEFQEKVDQTVSDLKRNLSDAAETTIAVTESAIDKCSAEEKKINKRIKNRSELIEGQLDELEQEIQKSIT